MSPLIPILMLAAGAASAVIFVYTVHWLWTRWPYPDRGDIMPLIIGLFVPGMAVGLIMCFIMYWTGQTTVCQ